MGQPKRLRDALDRNLAGYPVPTNGAVFPKNPGDDQATALAFVQVDESGAPVAGFSSRDQIGDQFTTISSSTAETTIVTAVAATYLDLSGLIIANKSATATNVTIRNATGGTVATDLYLPAGDTRGFIRSGTALKQAAVNNNWTAQSSASVDSLYITAMFVKSV